MDFLTQDEIKKNIVTNINAGMKALGKTQQELADFLGVAQQTVSKYCVGLNVPNEATMNKIAYFLGVSVNELYGNEPLVFLSDEEKEFVLKLRSDSEFKNAIKKIVESGNPTIDEMSIVKKLRENPSMIEIVKRVLDIKD